MWVHGCNRRLACKDSLYLITKYRKVAPWRFLRFTIELPKCVYRQQLVTLAKFDYVPTCGRTQARLPVAD